MFGALILLIFGKLQDTFQETSRHMAMGVGLWRDCVFVERWRIAAGDDYWRRDYRALCVGLL